MNNNKEKVISILNDLLTRHYDAEQGFIEAANHISEISLHEWFRTKANQHKIFGHEIKAHLLNLGGEPQKGTSTLAELHQFWIDLQSYFNNNDPVEILSECERGEAKTLEDYEKAIQEVGEASVNTKIMLLQHQIKIKNNVDTLKAMQKMYVPTESK